MSLFRYDKLSRENTFQNIINKIYAHTFIANIVSISDSACLNYVSSKSKYRNIKYRSTMQLQTNLTKSHVKRIQISFAIINSKQRNY